ncbi:GGDEF domain-containing protein [Shewanella yunxiaonensis]|uniref:GGDEF domain-containing protein n=1 Tax=Shewanella yunxiaonensis TaxID=2829809 RepID=A0ABX7YW14_9GAMM|nr:MULTISPECIES: GGDEF domain-containing protein [Shewanella]MDF0533181.1 GGDEF domain-containing protein [Shewanella sp. A32]QUN06526.1 GGDEF domain-containing protein [Shewanella yunxiaonensis]
MLPESVKPGISLLENDNHGLNLVRWMHQCELMKHYYQADKVFVLQKTDSGFEVIVSAADNSMQFAPGKTFAADSGLLHQMAYSSPDGLNLDLTQGTADEYPDEFRSVLSILSRPVHWPDGSIFGCLCVLNAHANENQHVSPLMLEPFQILLQQDLALLCQNHRIEALSMRDADTGMLNNYGFIMMAPRQLNLGRRFGAHCGVIFFELEPNGVMDDELLKRCHQELANLLLTTLRAADIAAHYDNTKFVLLVFVDLERDLEHIVRRVERLFSQSPLPMSIDYSYRFFTPDSTAKLVAMVDEAKSGLRSSVPKNDA